MMIYAMREDFLATYLQKTMLASVEEMQLAHTMFANDAPNDIVSFNEDGDEATIAIMGPLSMVGPSFLDKLFGFGGTSYRDIIQAAISLRKNDNIKKVRMMISSPGGDVVGLGETQSALVELAKTKELIAENHGGMFSAAYFLAVAAHKIVTFSALELTGSLGVVIAGIDTSEALKREGITRVKVLSRNAPNKQADIGTNHGISVLQDQADATERVFLDIVAKGRSTTVEDVIENFGKGGIMVARDPDTDVPDAISVGMIDGIENEPANDGGNLEGNNVMDLSELKTKHPAIFAEAQAEGVTMERLRVSTHMALGESSGATKLAMENITKGVEHTGVSNALYVAAQMNAKAVSERGDEQPGDLDTSDSADKGDSELALALAPLVGVEI